LLDSGGQVDGEAGDVVVTNLDLAGMQPGSNRETTTAEFDTQRPWLPRPPTMDCRTLPEDRRPWSPRSGHGVDRRFDARSGREPQSSHANDRRRL
jgi:hypothetical protein